MKFRTLDMILDEAEPFFDRTLPNPVRYGVHTMISWHMAVSRSAENANPERHPAWPSSGESNSTPTRATAFLIYSCHLHNSLLIHWLD
jgi:hypothetical protein